MSLLPPTPHSSPQCCVNGPLKKHSLLSDMIVVQIGDHSMLLCQWERIRGTVTFITLTQGFCYTFVTPETSQDICTCVPDWEGA